MTIEFYSRLMSDYFARLDKAVAECEKVIEDMAAATEALEKSMPLEKKCFSEKNFLTSFDADGDPFIYDYLASIKNLTRSEEKRLNGLAAILLILSLPVNEVTEEFRPFDTEAREE